MRDAHRMKDKYDVSLDNRQIAGLLVGGVVVLGAVFVLGVVVGKSLAAGGQTSAPDMLSALDARQEALSRAQAESAAALTFHEELTRKAAEVAPAPQAKPPEAKPAEPKPAEVKVAEVKVADVKMAEAAPPEARPVADVQTAVAPEGAGKVEPASVTARTAEPGRMQQAIARATAQPPVRPAAVAPNGAYTLQLSAFQTREEADRFAAKLRGRGYAPYVVTAQLPGKGTWYRVRMGSFDSKDRAQHYLADFKRETQLQAIVATKD